MGVFSFKNDADNLGVLDLVPEQAAAAYSIRKLSKDYNGPAIRVRRSSDNAEQDIGFDGSGNLDIDAITNFINTPLIRYQSDFSAGESISETNGTGLAPTSIGGVDNAYQFTLTGGVGYHGFPIGSLYSGDGINTYRISFDYYIPSGQGFNSLRFTSIPIGPVQQNGIVLDQWVNYSYDVPAYTSANMYAGLGTGTGPVGNDGDVFYIKNVVITQLTENVLVTTWYDQSGSGKNATQTIAANQPKIVNAGVLVAENGKPGIDFDGVNDIFVVSDANIRSFYSVQSGSGDDILSTTQNRVIYSNALFDWQEKNFDAVLSIDTTNQALTSFNDSLDGLFSHNGSTYTNSGVGYIQGSEILNRIGGNDNGVIFWNGTIQEFIFYNTDKSADRTNIESNINNYFKIY